MLYAANYNPYKTGTKIKKQVTNPSIPTVFRFNAKATINPAELFGSNILFSANRFSQCWYFDKAVVRTQSLMIRLKYLLDASGNI